MTTLAIETVSAEKSLALAEDRVLVAELRFSGDLRQVFWKVLEFFLEDRHLSISGVDLFAACRGPGSWTGVRFGLSVVKGWSAATGRPVFAPAAAEIAAPVSRARPEALTAAGHLALAAGLDKALAGSLVLPEYGYLPRFRKLGEKASVPGAG